MVFDTMPTHQTIGKTRNGKECNLKIGLDEIPYGESYSISLLFQSPIDIFTVIYVLR